MLDIEKQAGIGHYYIYAAHKGQNCTVLGVAFYDDEGILAGSKWRGSVEEAIRRGDLPDTELARSIGFDPAPTVEGMNRRLETIANAMSMTQWSGPFGTTVWSPDWIDRCYKWIIGG